MASKALSSPFIRYVAKRAYSGPAVMPALKEAKYQQCVLPSGTFVAALDNGSPVARVTIAFKAGSRYEPVTEAGISHVLRAAAGLSTGNCSSFIIARKLAQIGASVTASGDREFIYYTLEATQDNLESAIECLSNMVSNQEFRPWEVSDIKPRLSYDIAALSPQMRAVDLLHKAAYRRGLGNSLYVSPKRLGTFSSESLQHYAAVNVVPGKCAVTVVGEAQEKAVLLAQSLQLPTTGGEGYCAPSQYYGGQLRKEIGGGLTHVALALQGAPAGTAQSVALAVAAKALGNGPVTKWGADISLLGKALGNIGPSAAAGFNVSYSDSGLFGVVLSIPKDEATNAVKYVAKTLKNPALTPEAIAAAKNQLKLQVLTEAEAGTHLSEALASQGLYAGTAKTPADIIKDIDSVSASDVTGGIAKATNFKLSMAAVGNLAFCPYVDEL